MRLFWIWQRGLSTSAPMAVPCLRCPLLLGGSRRNPRGLGRAPAPAGTHGTFPVEVQRDSRSLTALEISIFKFQQQGLKWGKRLLSSYHFRLDECYHLLSLAIKMKHP